MTRVTMSSRNLILLTALYVGSAVEGFNNVHTAKCNAASQVPNGVSFRFILISPVIGDCVFLFRSPPESILDLKLISVGVDAYPLDLVENCSNTTLLNNFKETSRIELIHLICSQTPLQTDRNIAVVSPINNGFFVIEVRAIDKRFTHSVSSRIITGMNPPTVGAKDFFVYQPITPTSELEIRAVPTNSSSIHLKPSFAAPYPGKPTPLIDLTYNISLPMQAVDSPMTSFNGSTEDEEMFTEILEFSTIQTPTPSKGTSTFVEINISNSTAG